MTYGAGGSTREKTLEIVQWIQREAHITAMAHLTCVGATQHEIGGVLDRLLDAGIENIMALRGDPPAGQEKFVRTAGGFGFATDLVAFIRSRFGRQLCLGGAGYPEGHVECRDIDRDMRHLKARSTPASTSSSPSSSSTTASTSTSSRARARPASRSPSSRASCPSATWRASSA